MYFVFFPLQCTDLPIEIPSNNPISCIEPSNAVGVISYGTFSTDLFQLNENAQNCTNLSTFKFVWMLLEVARRKDGRQMNQVLAIFTDGPHPAFNPLLTGVIDIDSITEKDGTITLRDGEDVMVLQIPNQMCNDGDDEAKIQDEWRHVRDNLWTSFPSPLNLSICDQLGWDSSPFCLTLSREHSLLHDDNGDFCVRFTPTITKRRCKSYMRLVEATGIFSAKALVGKDVPREMFDVEWLEGDRSFDIVYPCFA